MEFKIVLVGDSEVGKTSFIKCQQNSSFDSKYTPTEGVDITSLVFNTTYGLITFKIWDCSGQEKYNDLREGYCYNADGVIIMFDLSNKETINNINKWVTFARNIVDNDQFVICGNKYDLPSKNRDISGVPIEFKNKFYHTSAKKQFGYKIPFMGLSKKLTGHADLVFLKTPRIQENSSINSSQITNNKKKVSLVTNPNGGIIRITYEFFNDGEIIG